MGVDCQHDLAEMETACADGMCPLCKSERISQLLAEKVALTIQAEALRAELDLVKGQLDADDTRIYDLYMETRTKLEQAEARARRLLEYVQHREGCCAPLIKAVEANVPNPCNCGLDDAING